jgi:hypothetical protein
LLPWTEHSLDRQVDTLRPQVRLNRVTPSAGASRPGPGAGGQLVQGDTLAEIDGNQDKYFDPELLAHP